MERGGKERRKEDQRMDGKDGMKGGGDTERALRRNGRWGGDGEGEKESKDKCGKQGKMKGRSERKRQA